MNKVTVIGLTGQSGAGKGEVCRILSEYGIKSIDTDAVYHGLLIPPSECIDELAEFFGTQILDENGAVNRKVLASIVFASENQDKLETLNRITHKFILGETEKMIRMFEAEGYRAVAVDAPLLFESGFDKKCDTVVSVTAPYETRLERIIKRDRIDRERAAARLRSQKSECFYVENSDYIISNDGDTDDLKRQTETVVRKILGTVAKEAK